MSENKKKNIHAKKNDSLSQTKYRTDNKSLGISEYRKLADESLQGILIIQNEKIIYVNDAFTRIMGYSNDELLSFTEKEIVDLIHEPDKNQVWTNYKDRLAGKDIPPRYQIKLKSKTGKIKILDMYSQRFNYNGKPAVQAIFLDITEQTEALKALEESESKFRTIFEHSGVAMVITETDGTMIRVNQAFVQLFGYSSEELQGLKPTDLNYPGDLQQTAKLLNDFQNDKDVVSRQIEKKYLNKKGDVFWGLVTVTAIRDNKGKVVYLIGQLQDITKIKNAENELTKYAEKLKGINTSKDKFFSIISHDLRSPFNVLLSISEYASQYFAELSNDDIKEFITNIHSSAKKVYDLMQNLLEWAQGQLGKIEIEKNKIDLFDLSENVVSLYKGIADQKKTTLLNEVEKNTFIFADKYTIETVIRNLVSNSVKFTNKGGRIIVSAKLTGDFAAVTVEDTGIGISSEDQQKLFRIDEQFRTEGTEEEIGSGLGLILSKEFVELNGGEISVVSKVNSGSKFTFTVPSFLNRTN